MKELIYKYKDYFFLNSLQRAINNCSSVLDVGCGEFSPLARVKKKFHSVGIDIFDKSIKVSKKSKIHDKYINADIREIDSHIKPRTFEAVIALDVIEHFKKKEAKELIQKIEKIATKRVILLTPNGFYSQNEIRGNPHQVHHSGWSTRDLEKLGYKVTGLRGLKQLRGAYATIKYKPWYFWGLLSVITEPLLYFFPEYSYHLFAVKEIEHA